MGDFLSIFINRVTSQKFCFARWKDGFSVSEIFPREWVAGCSQTPGLQGFEGSANEPESVRNRVAAGWHRKVDAIKKLKLQAALRNPDEFAFGMHSVKTDEAYPPIPDCSSGDHFTSVSNNGESGSQTLTLTQTLKPRPPPPKSPNGGFKAAGDV